MRPIALSIAGSDPSGGAGIQADLKVFHAGECYGTAVITALTVQNTTGVQAIAPVEAALVAQQLTALFDDLPVAAAKTGMLSTPAIVAAVADACAAKPELPLVIDPVVRAGSGNALAVGDVLAALRGRLLPLATVITPNLDEAAALTGRAVTDRASMADAARALVDAGARAALVTGGHLPDRPVDVLCLDGLVHALDAPRIVVARTHGTGCTLTAAITAHLAHGHAVADAIARAKAYVGRALQSAPRPGHGAQPLDHHAAFHG